MRCPRLGLEAPGRLTGETGFGVRADSRQGRRRANSTLKASARLPVGFRVGPLVTELPEVHVHQLHEWVAHSTNVFDSCLLYAEGGDVVVTELEDAGDGLGV